MADEISVGKCICDAHEEKQSQFYIQGEELWDCFCHTGMQSLELTCNEQFSENVSSILRSSKKENRHLKKERKTIK